jgi:hypothetical protein
MKSPLVRLRWQGRTAPRDKKSVKEVWGEKSHEAGDQHHLIKYDAAVKDDRHGNHGLGDAKFAVETQQEKAAANDGKFPDDEMIPERRDCPIRNGIQLRASAIQNHVSEKGVENVQHDNPEQHREKSMTVTVDITAPKPVLSAPEKTSSPAEKCIAAQYGGGPFAAICLTSLIHIRK